MLLIINLLFIVLTGGGAQAKSLQVAGIEGGPYFFYDPTQKKPQGVIPKFVDQFVAEPVKKKYGYSIEWRQMPALRLLKGLETGDLDMILFLSKTPEREVIYNYGKDPFAEWTPAVIIKKDFTEKNKIDDLKIFKDKIVVTMTGTRIPDFFEKSSTLLYYITGSNISERTLILIEKNRFDGIYIHSHEVAEFAIKQFGFGDRLKILKLPVPKLKVYVTFSKKISGELRNFIDGLFVKHRPDYERLLKEEKTRGL